MERKNGAIISTREKVGTRETLALPPILWWVRFCSFGFPGSRSAPHYTSSERHGGQSRMERDSISQIKVELSRLFEEQVEFFRKRSLGELAPVEHHKYEKRRERIRQLFAELYGMRKVA